MKVLLAVDGSEMALAAVSTLVRHAKWFKDSPEVELAYVNLPVPKIGPFGTGPSKEALARYYREEGETALAKAEKLLGKAGVPYRSTILVGPIAKTLCRQAANRKCDLIWMGTRGMTAAANMLLGSVASQVLHAASVPVLLVK